MKKKPFGYSEKELERKASGEKVFPHVFGTDDQGRDIMVRVMVGTRVSITVGICAALLVLIIGAVYGSISGYCGGAVDAVMQRIVEMIYSIPEMLIILLLSATLKPALEQFQNSGNGILQKLVTILGPNLISMFIAFGLLYWVTMSRIIRGQILQLKICNSSQSTGSKRRKNYSKTSASELYRTDRYDDFPSDSVCDLPGIFPFFRRCRCICTVDQSGFHVFRSIKRSEHLSIQTVHSGRNTESDDSFTEPVW